MKMLEICLRYVARLHVGSINLKALSEIRCKDTMNILVFPNFFATFLHFFCIFFVNRLIYCDLYYWRSKNHKSRIHTKMSV